jgi:hypothetical protein
VKKVASFLLYYCAGLARQAASGLVVVCLVALAIRVFLDTTIDRTQRAFAYAWLYVGGFWFLLMPLGVLAAMIVGLYDPVRDDSYPQAELRYFWARLVTSMIAWSPLAIVARRCLRRPLKWPGRMVVDGKKPKQ